MNFAVIEYSSKSGEIWKHTRELPNFLADPEQEIDPTSFGGYVSALGGEHIPLTGLIVGNVYELSSSVRLRRRIHKKILKRWPQDYSLEYLKRFDVLLVVHQISDGHEMTAFTKRLKEAHPHILILGVPTQPYGILKNYWEQHLRWLEDFRAFMDACDVFITIVANTKAVWQELTTTPVEYLPQPYPAEFATRFFRRPESKGKVIFVAGVTERENIQRGQTLAKLLQRELPDYLIHVTKIPSVHLDLSELAGARYTVVPFEPWRKHLVSLSKSMIVLNTDFTFTRGRVQMDCAAVGTPSLGANSDAQLDLFPALSATPDTLVDDLVELGRELLNSRGRYDRVVAAARQKLPQYNYNTTAHRLKELVARYRSRGVRLK